MDTGGTQSTPAQAPGNAWATTLGGLPTEPTPEQAPDADGLPRGGAFALEVALLLCLGNLASLIAWRRGTPINTGLPSIGLAATIYAYVVTRSASSGHAVDRFLPRAFNLRSLGFAGVTALLLSAPPLAFFKFPFLVGRIDYAPIQRLSPSALLVRVLVEIPFLTALSEELLFRGYLYERQRPSPAGRRIATNTLLSTAWHLVVALRTTIDSGLHGQRGLLALGYLGQLVSITVGGALFCLVREKTHLFLYAGIAHWIVDTALTVGIWLR